MNKISIKDIAKICGVSTATVSRVINNNGRFSEETQKKVMQAIEETGYQMNYSAKSLRMNKSYTIGIIVPDISNYFFSQTLMLLESLLFKFGYSTIIANTGRNLEKENAYLKMLSSKLVDGLIVISGTEKFSIPKKITNIPYICIDREPANKKGAVFIASDHYHGGYMATKYLIDNGSKNPAVFILSRQSSASLKRLQAFKDVLNKYNYTNTQKHIAVLDYNNMVYDIKKYINLYQPDAIFSVNDDIAASTLQTLHSMNIDVPKKVQIIGYDNSPVSQFTLPTLSTIEQNIDSIAETAVQKLLEIIEMKDVRQHEEELILPVKLIKRQSTL